VSIASTAGEDLHGEILKLEPPRVPHPAARAPQPGARAPTRRANLGGGGVEEPGFGGSGAPVGGTGRSRTARSAGRRIPCRHPLRINPIWTFEGFSKAIMKA